MNEIFFAVCLLNALSEEKIFLIAELNKHVSVAEENLEAENTEIAEEKIEQQDEEAVGDDEVKEESSGVLVV